MKWKDYYTWFIIGFVIAFMAVIEKRARLLYIVSGIFFAFGVIYWIMDGMKKSRQRKKKEKVRK